MMQRFYVALGVLALTWSGCGGSSTDLFDAQARGSSAGAAGQPAAGGSPSAGGAPSVGGALSTGGAGSPSAAGSIAVGGSAGASNPGAPCSPVREVTAGASGPFDSTGAVCLKVSDAITGWGCSNFEGRTVKVNGTPVTCAQVPLPERIGGAYYFDISAGMFDYASMYWFQ